jgi:peptidyl-prolyl cis-trans isomerase B (cyclophilin B)
MKRVPVPVIVLVTCCLVAAAALSIKHTLTKPKPPDLPNPPHEGMKEAPKAPPGKLAAAKESPAPETKATSEKPAKSDKTVVRITTSKGVITAELFDDKAPITAGNFELLAGKGFYDGRTIFRVEPGFCIQTGDPKDTGTGGPGYTIPDELREDLKHDKGILSMAKTEAPNSGGSQFFICLGGPETTGHLDMKHSVFGKVTKGMDVVEKITVGDKMQKVEIVSESSSAAGAKKKAKAAQKPDKPGSD